MPHKNPAANASPAPILSMTFTEYGGISYIELSSATIAPLLPSFTAILCIFFSRRIRTTSLILSVSNNTFASSKPISTMSHISNKGRNVSAASFLLHNLNRIFGSKLTSTPFFFAFFASVKFISAQLPLKADVTPVICIIFEF